MLLLSRKFVDWVRRDWLHLSLILVLALAVRLYRLHNPVLDWHAFRQADTAAVTRHYVKHGINLLKPKYHDLSNIQSGRENPEGYRMVEFPLVNALIAALIRLAPSLDLVTVSRFTSVLFSLGTAVSLYYLVKTISNQTVAKLSALFFAILPFAVYYSRVILPEPALLFFSTLSLASFAAFVQQPTWPSWLVSSFSLALAFLLKPFVVFTAPAYLVLLLKKPKRFKDLRTWLLALIGPAPLVAWRRWIKNFPAGIPAAGWLLNSNKIRLKPAWFRWIFWERLTKLILGYSGLIWLPGNFLVFNFGFWFLLAWALGLLSYLIVFATGNVQHDYYQNLLLPALAYGLGRGLYFSYQWLHSKIKNICQNLSIEISLNLPLAQPSLFADLKLSTGLSLVISSGLILSQLFFSWQKVKGFYHVNHPQYLQAGQAADQLLPPDAKVIAPANGDTLFLFQTNRPGWPLGVEIEDKIEQGATHYVSVNYDNVAQDLEKRYTTVKKTADYIILDLTKPK